MSRIGNRPITVPTGVEIEITDGNAVTVTGPKGTLSQSLSPAMALTRENGSVLVARPNN